MLGESKNNISSKEYFNRIKEEILDPQGREVIKHVKWINVKGPCLHLILGRSMLTIFWLYPQIAEAHLSVVRVLAWVKTRHDDLGGKVAEEVPGV